MCYKIHPDNLIANYFAVSGKNEITFQQLAVLRKEIEEAFNFTISVDVTANSIYKVVRRSGECFELGKTFIRINESMRLNLADADFVDSNYNWEIPSNIKNKYLKVLESAEE